MLIENLEDFKEISKIKGRIAGLDLGRKNIGIAISDRDKNIATPKEILVRKSNKLDFPKLLKTIQDNSIIALVVGLPLNQDLQDTDCSLYVKRFMAAFLEFYEIPVFFNDERLTSFAVEDCLIDNLNISFKKTKSLVDKIAASYILQDILNKIKL